MAIIISFSAVTLFLLVFGQAIYVARFVYTLGQAQTEKNHGSENRVPSEECPRVTVILPLRGCDPFLQKCIEGLLFQDYENYSVIFVIDHPDDSSREVVEKCIGDSPVETKVIFLESPSNTCSLKCSSLLAAIETLPESCEIVAQLDADTLPHVSWLSELVGPFSDESVGATTGNRWYMPEQLNVGSMVRYAWNAAAVVQMVVYRIAWGGTLAIRTRVFRETDLLECWSRTFTDDTVVYSVLKKSGFTIAFVPSLMMVNRESCRLGDFYRWVKRQLLTARLYHPAWPLVVGHGVITSLVPLSVLVATVVMLLRGAWFEGLVLGAVLFAYQLLLVALVIPLESSVRKVVEAKNEPTKWIGFSNAIQYISAIWMAQWVYFPALLTTCVMRKSDWRGVTYQIHGPHQIEMEEYLPYRQSQSASQQSL